MEPEIIGIPEMALLMCRTESSIRTAVSRIDKNPWLPPPDKQGRRVCWNLEKARKYIREYAEGQHRKPKVGRPRQLPQLVGQRFG
jgi:DNA-binding transcriptional regulator PaaX